METDVGEKKDFTNIGVGLERGECLILSIFAGCSCECAGTAERIEHVCV